MQVSTIKARLNKDRFDRNRLGTRAQISDCDGAFFAENLDIVDSDGRKLAAIRKIPQSLSGAAISSLKTIRYATSNRLGTYGKSNAEKSIKGKLKNTRGLKQAKAAVRTFGFQPANGIFRNYCGVTGLFAENKKAFIALCDFASVASDFLLEHFPEQYKLTQRFLCDNVLSDWILPGSVFTGGIANKNNEIDYHVDAANVANSMAVMLSVREPSAGGGWLCLPEINVRLKLANSTLVAFPNTEWVHGVTPIYSESGNRYSAVWYTNRQFKNCRCRDEELARARKATTETAKNRARKDLE